MPTRSRSGRVLRSLLRGLTALCILVCGLVAHGQNALEQVRGRQELIIATDPTYPPFEFKDNAGRLVGFDIDLGNEIGRELGVKVTWLPLEWTAVLGALEAQKADVILSGMTITAERKKKGYTFSRPYFLSGQTIARRTDDPRINGSADLKDKIVSVQDETTGLYALQKMGIPNDHIRKFDALPDGVLDVRNRKSDAVVADIPALKWNVHHEDPDMKIVGGAFTQEYLGVAARRDELELAAAIDQALDTILVDGRYARIYAKWIQEPVTTQMIAELYRVRDQGTAVPADTAAKVAGELGTGPAAETTGSSQASRSGAIIRWDLLKTAFPQLLNGAKVTLWVTALTLIIGVFGGLLVALARLSALRLLKVLATIYVEVVRGTPLLMQIYTIYFVLPAIHISLPPLLSGVVALSLNAAAYISEIFRAGIESIDAGQMEAAQALGMDYRGAMRWVILPQTIRRVLPPLTNDAVALLKDSSLVSVVAVTELMRTGKELAANTGAPTTLFLAVALIYLAMTLPLTWLVRRLEAKWQPVRRAPKSKEGSTNA